MLKIDKDSLNQSSGRVGLKMGGQTLVKSGGSIILKSGGSNFGEIRGVKLGENAQDALKLAFFSYHG